MKKLAIVGAGPKAAALAAKCAVLHATGQTAPELVIYERDGIGAAWCGEFSFTDGISKICTPIDRDLGFPYSDVRNVDLPISNSINSLLLGGFSWRAFLSETDILDGESDDQPDVHIPDLNEWMSKGCPPPTHRQFSKYLGWAIDKAIKASEGRVKYIETAVQDISHDGTQWRVVASGLPVRTYDGVVVTGLGPQLLPLIDDDLVPSGLFDGCNFWLNDNLGRIEAEVQRLVDLPTGRPVVAVVGQGGTAAAVACYLCREFRYRDEIDVHIYGSSPFFDSRPANFFSDRFYSDPDSWRTQTPHFRREFTMRTTRGRVWQQIIEEIQHYDLTYVCGRVVNVAHEAVGRTRQFRLDVDEQRVLGVDEVERYEAEILIDCRGFDNAWFLNLVSGGVRDELLIDDQRSSGDAERLQANLDNAFALTGENVPYGLHIPNFGGMVHAAATNLMALGSVADSILEPYRG